MQVTTSRSARFVGAVSVLAVLILILLVSGIAVAVHDANTIHACVRTSDGAVRVVSSATDCRSNETPVEWNKQGPPGPAGPQGPTGPAGALGPQGDPGPAGTAQALELFMPAFSIPVGFSSDATMLAMELPAGAWALNGKVGLYASSSSAGQMVHVFCQMSQDGSDALDNVQQSLYLPTTPGVQYFNVPLQGTATFTEPTTVRLLCRQFGLDPTTVSNGFGTKLTATQVTTQTRTEAEFPGP